MTDLVFGPAVVLSGAGDPWLTGISDLDVVQGPDGTRVYVTTGPGGGIAVYEMTPAGMLVETDRFALTGSPAAGVESRLTFTADGMAMVTGMGAGGVWGIGTDAAGNLTARADLGTTLPGTVHATATATVGGTEYLYGLRLGSSGIAVWEVGPDGRLTAVSSPGGGSAAAGPVLTDLVTVTVGGQALLLVTSAGADALISCRIGADGVPVEVARIDNAKGLGAVDPMAVTAAVVDGATYAVWASAGTGTLTVAQVGSNGSLTVTDHIMDDMGTRFQGASIVETITIAGRTWVVAAGADDGITLFELLPGGRLLDRGTLVDTGGTTLDNVASVALAEEGGDLQVIVASGSEPGVTVVEVDLVAGQRLYGGSGNETLTAGGGADLVSGAGGNDRLTGGGGNDVLMDGAGVDTLTGGAGGDIFVLSADRQADTIADFDPAQDRLDLSGWANLRSTSQLTITATADGAEIRFGSEVLILRSANGQSLDPQMLYGLDMLGPSRLGPGFVPEVTPPMTFTGGAGNDTRVGSNAADTLYGGGGNDSFRGGFGNDRIEGGEGDDRLSGESDDDLVRGDGGVDTLYGGQGKDRLYGGAGADLATGGTEADSLWGDDGNDSLSGESGDDLIYGGAGGDRLSGGDWNDLVQGGDGNDSLEGGNGLDRLYGENGDDRIAGGAGNDLIYGGSGNDLAWGEDGNETIAGSAGVDELRGDAGNDSLLGESGNDRLYGGDGDDRVSGGTEVDSLYGGGGIDWLYGGAATDRIWAGGGDDALQGEDAADSLWGEAGNDTLFGGAGGDLVYGGDGADLLQGDPGNDTLHGEGGADRIIAGSENDWGYGGAGHDSVTGKGGTDRLYGGSGNDSLNGGDGTDSLYGGDGVDALHGGEAKDVILGGGGNDSAQGDGGADRLQGDAGADRLWGGGGADSILGGDGNDRLWGDGEADTLSGGAGNDMLYGGRGNDRLTGGAGADRFVFDGGQDRVTDYVNNQDTIMIDGDLWSGPAPSVRDLVGDAVVTAQGVRIPMPGGQWILVEGIDAPNMLLNDIEFF